MPYCKTCTFNQICILESFSFFTPKTLGDFQRHFAKFRAVLIAYHIFIQGKPQHFQVSLFYVLEVEVCLELGN